MLQLDLGHGRLCPHVKSLETSCAACACSVAQEGLSMASLHSAFLCDSPHISRANILPSLLCHRCVYEDS
eukprot:1158637-Pelagomonas_calceolata.AAC.5